MKGAPLYRVFDFYRQLEKLEKRVLPSLLNFQRWHFPIFGLKAQYNLY